MMRRRWISLGGFALASLLTNRHAEAQLAPTGGHYGGRPSDTGFSSFVNSSGGYSASIPLDLPAARGGMPVPVQVVYGEHGVGAAGAGWDIPLSFIRREITFAHARPVGAPGATPHVRGLWSVVLSGRRIDLVQDSPTTWVARRDAPEISVRQQGDGFVLYDGNGWTYTFSVAAPSLIGSGLWHLASITGPGGNKVALNYTVGAPSVAGAPDAVSIDLTSVQYNNDTAGCFKNTVSLGYAAASSLLSISLQGTKTIARVQRLSSVTVSAQSACGASETLRTYQLSYLADADTQLPRLSGVTMTGRQGTPEASTSLTIGRYQYGSATNTGALRYTAVPGVVLASGPSSLGLGATRSDAPAGSTSSSFLTEKSLLDVTGDGRPDVVLPQSVTLNAPQNGPAPVKFTGVTGFPSPVERRSSNGRRYDERPDEIRDSMTYRQAIDVNGDGRIDVVDASEQAGAWTVYLNTPDPTDPRKVVLQKRSYDITALTARLRAAGLWSGDAHLPLSVRSTGHDQAFKVCVKWNGRAWVEFEDPEGTVGSCPQGGVFLSAGGEKTIVAWELRDINGDGYPDVVFNSGGVRGFDEFVLPPPPTRPDQRTHVARRNITVDLDGRASNKIQAAINVLGTAIGQTGGEPYSETVDLRANAACGFSRWVAIDSEHQQLACDLVDVNGDGLPDLVEGTSVFLNNGGATGQFFTAGALLTLPGQAAVQQNGQQTACAPPADGSATFSVAQLAGLRDLTGDGIPDYISGDGNGNWQVAIGTGVGFAGAIAITGTFELSRESEDCAGLQSTTMSGLFDLDGDGSPDVLDSSISGGSAIFWQRVMGGTNAMGAPDAGRLVQLDNGHGAITTISYRSAKEDGTMSHQLPFPEIVVASVATQGTQHLGGDLAATLYAYGGAEQVFDPALDTFTFRGYQRKVELQIPSTQENGIATISDSYAPASATDPFGLRAGSTTVATTSLQRYRTYLTAGRPKDVTVLSGDLGPDPWKLLVPATLALGLGSRIAASHYEWEINSLSKPSDPAGPEICKEMVFPYDLDASRTYATANGDSDLCAAHGFSYGLSVQSTRTQPGADLASASGVTTRSEVHAVDQYGRVTAETHLNDLNSAADDLCVTTEYATVGPNERVLSAVKARTVTACNGITYASDVWSYDHLPVGSVAAGFPTSHSVERRSDTGKLESTITEFDATYDAFGNPMTMTTTREDGASRTVTLAYDAFALAPIGLTTTATNVETTTVSVDRDPATLSVLGVTDANGTRHGSILDGFDRPRASTITTPDGITGLLSTTSYVGFADGDTGARHIIQKVYTDPIDPRTALTDNSRTSTTYLDELGRPTRAEVALGASYANQIMVVGNRVYDHAGRVVFTADPYPASQSFDTAYGTTRFFNADGTLACSVRANGQLATFPTDAPSTNETSEIYPTCFTRTFQDHTEVVTVQDAASLLTGSPQYGVIKTSTATAIGRTISRSTSNASGRLEHATFNYDVLGHVSGMTRYQDAVAGSKPVTWTWHTDSLGQLVELDESDLAPQVNTYSNWGELVSVQRTYPTPGAGSAGTSVAPDPDDPPPSSPPAMDTLAVVKRYDALGRLVHSEEQLNGARNPETVNDYLYDQAVNLAPQVSPTNMHGRLAQAISPTGAVAFSYDGFGNANARVFVDRRSNTYVEKHTFHGDGSPSALDLFLPDTGYSDENVVYSYDSAGRGISVQYNSGSETRQLYSATTIDPFGRVRGASYGEATYAATYADVGRRLISQASVTSASGTRAFAFQGFDPMGRERSRSETKNTGPAASTTFAYDALGRLSASVQSGGTGPFNQQFSYDPLGNLLSLTDTGASATKTTMSYLASDGDRICRISFGSDSATACNVGYDPFGNIVDEPTRTGTRHFTFFADGNPRSISDATSSATFRYDALGEVQELDLTSSSSPDVRTDRRYGLIEGRTEGGSFVYTRTIPGPDGFVATRHGPAGGWTFAFGEARGSRFFTDEHGAFVQDVNYTPFGEARSTGAAPGSAQYSKEQWNGGDALAAFGLSHLGARLYDPVIGRFLSRDPLLIPRTAATTSPYAFADNDPTNSSDPSGLSPQAERPGDKEHTDEEPQVGPAAPSFDEAGSLTLSLDVGLYSHAYTPHYNGAGGSTRSAVPVDIALVAMQIQIAATVGLVHDTVANRPITGNPGIDHYDLIREQLAAQVEESGAVVGGVLGSPIGPGGAVAGAAIGAGETYAIAQWLRGKPATVTGAFGAMSTGGSYEAGGQLLAPYIVKLLRSALGPALRMLREGRYVPTDFASAEHLEKHFGKHSVEWGPGNITKTAYLERARSLLSSEVGGNIAGATRANGDVLRYNLRTNEFATGRADGTIKTLFRPQDGLLYWLGQIPR